MAAPIVWSGDKAKLLKSGLDFFGNSVILSGPLDPSLSPITAPLGSLYLSTNGNVYINSATGWQKADIGNAGVSAGDIPETAFTGNNNQSSLASVVGLSFDSQVSSFEALLTVVVLSSDDLMESFKLHGVSTHSGWVMSQSSVGDNTGVEFSINSSGQVQYTSPNFSNFNSLIIKFRANTLTT